MDLPPSCLDFLVGAGYFQLASDGASLTAVSLVEIVALVSVQVLAGVLVLQVELVFALDYFTGFLLGAFEGPVVIEVTFTKFSEPSDFLPLAERTFVVFV